MFCTMKKHLCFFKTTLWKLNKITSLFSTQTTVLSPRPSLTTTPQFSHIPPFDLHLSTIWMSPQLQLPPSLCIIPHPLTLPPCSHSMRDFLYNGPVTPPPPNRKYFLKLIMDILNHNFQANHYARTL